MMDALTIYGLSIPDVVGVLGGIAAIYFGFVSRRGKKLAERVSALELARTEADTFRTSWEAEKKENQNLREENQALRFEISGLNDQVKMLQGRLEQFEKFVASPQSIIEHQKANMEMIVQAIGAIGAKFSTLEKEIAGLRKDMKAARA